jgi:hypothetical protein
MKEQFKSTRQKGTDDLICYQRTKIKAGQRCRSDPAEKYETKI